MNGSQVVDTTALATLLGLVLPLIVQVLVKQSASDGLKAVVNLAGVVIASVLTLWINPHDGEITWQLAVNTAMLTLIASGGAYKFLWKPTGVSGTIAQKTAGFGLSSPPTVQTEEKGAEDTGQVDEDPMEGVGRT